MPISILATLAWLASASPAPGTSGAPRQADARGMCVTGRVTDAHTGEPIEGADGRSGSLECKTDADGAYRLEGSLRAGEIQLVACKQGYVPAKHILDTRSGTLVADFALLPARRVSGRVLDRLRRPLAEARVEAIASAGGISDHLWTDTGPDGRFEMESLRADMRHLLRISKPGHGTALYDCPADVPGLDPIAMGILWLSPEGSIAGRFQRARGGRVDGLCVDLEGWNLDRTRLSGAAPMTSPRVGARTTFTDAEGRFRFDELPEGDFALSVSYSAAGGLASYGLELALALASGERRELRVWLEESAAISGGVWDPAGEPVAGASVRTAGGKWVSTETGSDGGFTFPELPPGTYALTVLPPKPQPEHAPLGPVRVTGIRAGSAGVRVVLAPREFIEGVVLDARGRPLHPAAVWPGWEWSLEPVFTDERGRFRLTVSRGAVIDAFHVQRFAWSPLGVWQAERLGPKPLARDVLAGTTDLVLRVP